jgi:dolichol kinase
VCIGAIVALIESYTKYWVMLVRPITRRVQRRIAHQTTIWMFRFYPDDNLLIPLLVALLAGLLPHIM